MEHNDKKIELLKMTKAELAKLLLQQIEQFNDAVTELENKLQLTENELRRIAHLFKEATIKKQAYGDLLGHMTDTKSFEGLNETQINTILKKRMLTLKYYHDK